MMFFGARNEGRASAVIAGLICARAAPMVIAPAVIVVAFKKDLLFTGRYLALIKRRRPSQWSQRLKTDAFGHQDADRRKRFV